MDISGLDQDAFLRGGEDEEDTETGLYCLIHSMAIILWILEGKVCYCLHTLCIVYSASLYEDMR